MRFIKIGALWQAVSRSGSRYMNGKVNEDITLRRGEKIYVFQNTDRKNDKSPTATLMIGRPDDTPPVEIAVEDAGVPADDGTKDSVEPIGGDNVPF
jgi:hypothetical protein